MTSLTIWRARKRLANTRVRSLDNIFVYSRLQFSLSIPVIELLPNSVVFVNELLEFLTQRPLLLFQAHYFRIQLLESFLKIHLVLQNGRLVLLLNCQLHLLHFQSLGQLISFHLDVFSLLLFLASCFFTLVEVSS